MKDITCLAEGITYLADSSLTGLNLNELIVGGTGCGKDDVGELGIFGSVKLVLGKGACPKQVKGESDWTLPFLCAASDTYN